MTEAENARTTSESNEEVLDDRGTTAGAGLELLKRLRDTGFDADDGKLAMALGRPVEEVAAWMSGGQSPDDDIIMKARGIAKERGIELE